ncbi:hypothetical protein FKM82_001066 [Ascaphus truei]
MFSESSCCSVMSSICALRWSEKVLMLNCENAERTSVYSWNKNKTQRISAQCCFTASGKGQGIGNQGRKTGGNRRCAVRTAITTCNLFPLYS